MKIKVPYRIISDLKYYAPSFSKEGDTRGYGYDDYEETFKSFEAVAVYVQKGLAEKTDVFEAVVKTIFEVQEEPGRLYPIIVASFGAENHLTHEGKYFEMGYMNDRYQDTKIIETLQRLSAEKEVEPAIIPELFPKTDSRSLYQGKTSLSYEDLLIIIGKKDEVFFHKNLEKKIEQRVKKKCTLFVEIDQNDVNWVFSKLEPKF